MGNTSYDEESYVVGQPLVNDQGPPEDKVRTVKSLRNIQYHLTIYRLIKYVVCWLIIFMLGISVLLPFNALITAVDYFGYVFGDSFSFIITFSCNLPIIFVMLALMKWGGNLGFDSRIVISLIVYCICLFLIPLFSATINSSVAYPLVILTTIVIGK
jgi:hypothetical protein